eukprot:s405_g20.t1
MAVIGATYRHIQINGRKLISSWQHFQGNKSQGKSQPLIFGPRVLGLLATSREKAMGEEEICLICHDGILEQPVSVLQCGHVYHRKCIASWMNQSRGECPQCKQFSNELRALHFDQTTALLSSNLEIRSDLAASDEERQRNLTELNQTWHDVLKTLAASSQRREEAQKEAEDAKLQRRKLQEQEPVLQVEKKVLWDQLKEAQKKCAETQFYLEPSLQPHHQRHPYVDEAHHQQSHKLPAVPPRQDDEDAVYERKKLHQALQAGLRASDRLKDLHRQLVSSLKQEAEVQSLARKRQAAAEEAEAVVRGLRAKVEDLRKERSQKDLRTTGPEISLPSGRSADVFAGPDGQRLDCAEELPKRPALGEAALAGRPALEQDLEDLDFSSQRSDTRDTPMPGGTPPSPKLPAVANVLKVQNRRPATPSLKGGPKPEAQEEEEDRLLFGGPAKLQRKGSAGFGRARAPVVAPSAPPAQVVTMRQPQKKSIKTLFEAF